MKTYLVIILLAIICSCSVKNKYVYVAHLDVKELGVSFVDSLIQENIDTILSYYEGCAGCIPGTRKFFWVYWENQGIPNIVKFTNYSKYYPLKISFKSEFTFIDKLIPQLKNDSINRGYSLLNHYAYEEFQIISPYSSYKYMITADASNLNQGSYSVLVIDKFKSMIHNSSDWYWESYAYKQVKIKRAPNTK